MKKIIFKILRMLFVVGLTLYLFLFCFFIFFPKLFPILPSKVTEWTTNYTVKHFLENENFPRKLLASLNNHPEVVTPNMYRSIVDMYVFSQDKDTFDTKDLIIKVNTVELYCYIIPSYREYLLIDADYAGYSVAEAIGEKWRCPK